MLAIFHKAFAHPPQELNSPVSASPSCVQKPKLPRETLDDFLSSNPGNAFAMEFRDAAVLAYKSSHTPQRVFCGYDDMYCIFMGNLDNLCSLIKQYGLARNASEATVVIEAYRTLRDRGPYPVDQVIRDLNGSFAFVLYDHGTGTVFTALGSDGRVKMYWGMGADGSVAISDDKQVMKHSCCKSYAPFPPGCVFHSEGGLMSFEHPMNKMRAISRVDSEGVICGANFKVDLYARMNTIPRVGSEANWRTLG